MRQAKVLTELELKRVLAVIAQGRHAGRNRLAILLSHQLGLRVREIASLRLSHVLDQNGAVRDEVRLAANQTKGREARVVFVNGKLKREIERYVGTIERDRRPERPLLMTQRRTAFSPNTLCQLMAQLYRRAGIDGASSHSGRRWFITRLAHAGISAKVIMALAGHRQLSTTQKYIDVNDEMLRRAVEVI
jgi:integrase/recombinase XerD